MRNEYKIPFIFWTGYSIAESGSFVNSCFKLPYDRKLDVKVDLKKIKQYHKLTEKL